MTLLEIAQLFLYVREAGPNKGLRVEAIQKWCDGDPGDSWCCEWVTMVLDLYYHGNAPVPRLKACQDVLDLARKNNWLVTTPQTNDLVLSVNDQGHAHHIGICVWPNPLSTIAANTSEDGLSSNGDRVAQHTVNSAGKIFVRLPR